MNPLQYNPGRLMSDAEGLSRALAMQRVQQGNALQRMQMDAAQQQMAQQEHQRNALQQFTQSMPSPQMMAAQQGLAGGGGPTQANAARMPQVDPRLQMLYQAMKAGAVDPMAYANQAYPAPREVKVARTIEIRGPDGKPYTVQVDEQGNPVGKPMPKWVSPSMQNLGDRVEVVDPTEVSHGQRFGLGLKPGERERIDISRTAAGAASRQAIAAEDANRVAREQQAILRGQQIAEGEAKAKDRALKTESAVANFESAIGVIDKAINHPGRATATGLSGQVDPRNYMAGTDAKNFQIVAKQLEGQAFLEAFESLKGGGQITQIEGEKATAAKARLDRAQSDAEYVQALNDLRDIVVGAYERTTGKKYQAPRPAPVDTGAGVPAVELFNRADSIIGGK